MRDLFHHIVNQLGCGGFFRVIKDGTGRNVISAVVLRSALEWVEANKYCVIESHKMRNQSKMSLEGFFEANDSMYSVIFWYNHVHKASRCTCIHRISKAQLYTS